jgi:hypothetical protein
MPFGIIDTKGDAPLAGTEFLIRNESASTEEDVESTRLKRVLFKARWTTASLPTLL